jgi:hypothetical protein
MDLDRVQPSLVCMYVGHNRTRMGSMPYKQVGSPHLPTITCEIGSV